MADKRRRIEADNRQPRLCKLCRHHAATRAGADHDDLDLLVFAILAHGHPAIVREHIRGTAAPGPCFCALRDHGSTDPCASGASSASHASRRFGARRT